MTNLEKLVGSLLPLLVHGVRSRSGSETDGTEDSNAGGDTRENTPEDAGTRAGRVLSTGTVGTESDPVGYQLDTRVSWNTGTRIAFLV